MLNFKTLLGYFAYISIWHTKLAILIDMLTQNAHTSLKFLITLQLHYDAQSHK